MTPEKFNNLTLRHKRKYINEILQGQPVNFANDLVFADKIIFFLADNGKIIHASAETLTDQHLDELRNAFPHAECLLFRHESRKTKGILAFHDRKN